MMTFQNALKLVSASAFGFALSFSSVMAVDSPGSGKAEPFIISGRVTVQFEDHVETGNFKSSFGKANFSLPSLDQLLEQVEAFDARPVFPWRTERPPTNSGLHDLSRIWEIHFPDSIDVREVVSILLQNPHVRHAEPVWALPLTASPNDPGRNSQWAMSPPGPDPHFYDAWDLETGSDSVKFAVVDTGVNYKHADLIGNIWVNPGEDLDGDGVVYDPDDLNGLDDDGNGVADDLIGYDFFTGFGGIGVAPGEDGGGRDPDPNDFNGHGTHIAGIGTAMNNNGVGVTGIAGGWFGGHRSFRGASIMCIRVGGTADDGGGYVNSNNCGQAIDYAAMMGATAINCSWGSQGTSSMIQGMANAATVGVTVVHAGGNDNQEVPQYLDNLGDAVLSVAATTSNDTKWGSSNFGYWIDVSAPGHSIYSTNSFHYNPSYSFKSGTSMAAPMVCGTALLIKSMMPSLSREQIDSIIIASADNIDAQNPSYIGLLGSGRVNAFNALANLANAKFTADVTEGVAPLAVNFTDLSPNSPVAWEWSFGSGDSSTMQNPTYTYTQPGIYSVSLRVDENNPLGLGEEHLRDYIWVRDDTLEIDSIIGIKGNTVSVPVYLRNSSLSKEIQFAFSITSHPGVTVDTFDIAATRAGYFEDVSFAIDNPVLNQWVITMKPDIGNGSNYLPIGSGIIINLRLAIQQSAPSGLVLIDTMTVSSLSTTIFSLWGNYFPSSYKSGAVLIGCAYGDSNCDGGVGNILDLTYIVDFQFRGGPESDIIGGDVNADTERNILDLTYLVDYIFRGGPPPPPPPG